MAACACPRRSLSYCGLFEKKLRTCPAQGQDAPQRQEIDRLADRIVRGRIQAIRTGASPSRPRLGSARLGSARLGSARLGSARLGSARLGSARLGSARLGSARLGSARLGSARLGSARLGSARLGSARLGSARLGSARLGSARLGSARLGSARLGSARLGSARLGSARLWSRFQCVCQPLDSFDSRDTAPMFRCCPSCPTGLLRSRRSSKHQCRTAARRDFSSPRLQGSRHVRRATFIL